MACPDPTPPKEDRTLSVENATNFLLHAWRQEWGSAETAEALRIVGAGRETILAALEKARAVIKAKEG